MVSVNRHGVDIIRGMVEHAEELNVRVHELDNGSTVVDCGVEARGGYDAGRIMAEVCMGGLGATSISTESIDGVPVPFLHAETDHPSVALLGSQKAGWSIEVGEFFAMGSGPARALAEKPKETYEKIGYSDAAEETAIVLEADELPGEEVTEQVAEECGVETEGVYALVAPTACVAGSVQVAARIVETTVYRLNELGYDTTKLVSGAGKAPIAPVKPKEAMGTTNDGQIYYGSAYLTAEDDAILGYLDDVPSENSEDYGKPFFETFEEAGFDFYEIDQAIFAPAEVTVNVESSGAVEHAGSLNEEVVKESFGL